MRHVDEDGASSVEYGLLALLIAAAVTAMVITLGQVNQGSYQESCNKITTAMGGDCTD